MTQVEKSIEVEVPITTAYNQWTQFEDFPQFMTGVDEVEQLNDRTLRWVAQIAGVRRQWIATILEQVPDEKVAWAATEGATNAGAVFFTPLGPGRTRVTLSLEYEPEGLVEKAGDAVGLVGRKATSDLERFKTFIESRGEEAGGWRGEFTDQPDVGAPTAEVAGDAAAVAAVRSSSGSVPPDAPDAPDAPAPDVVDVLMADHREVAQLVAEIELSDDPAERRELTDIVISELVRHSVAEEMYVYPAVRKHLDEGDVAVRHDTDEHKQLERIMKDLESADATDAAFLQLIQQLEATLTDHITDEEADQFPRLRARVPRAELVELAGKVESAKKRAPTRPHPGAPDAELFHKIVGPGVGLVDRLRDRLTGRATG